MARLRAYSGDGSGPTGAELVPLDADSSGPAIGADNAPGRDELQQAIAVQASRPMHRNFQRRADG